MQPDCRRRRRPIGARSFAGCISTCSACRRRRRRSPSSPADTDPLAWNRLVDRVLASPHFGERWARHWLDVVRFAETDGFETNVERPNAYPYRDYLIGAFNADKPYDRLVFEQLAGDSVGEDAATGFLVGGPCDKVKSPDPVLTRMQRQDELDRHHQYDGHGFSGADARLREVSQPQVRPDSAARLLRGRGRVRRRAARRAAARRRCDEPQRVPRRQAGHRARSNARHRRWQSSACGRLSIHAATTNSFAPVRHAPRAVHDSRDERRQRAVPRRVGRFSPRGQQRSSPRKRRAGVGGSDGLRFVGLSRVELPQTRASQRRPLRQRAELDFQRARQGLGDRRVPARLRDLANRLGTRPLRNLPRPPGDRLSRSKPRPPTAAGRRSPAPMDACRRPAELPPQCCPRALVGQTRTSSRLFAELRGCATNAKARRLDGESMPACSSSRTRCIASIAAIRARRATW